MFWQTGSVYSCRSCSTAFVSYVKSFVAACPTCAGEGQFLYQRSVERTSQQIDDATIETAGGGRSFVEL